VSSSKPGDERSAGFDVSGRLLQIEWLNFRRMSRFREMGHLAEMGQLRRLLPSARKPE
jgi:hypothetical protein